MHARRTAVLCTLSLVLAATGVLPAPASASTPAGLSYVAIGSSFAAGPGILPTEPGSPAACGRSEDNYPNIVARDIGAQLTDVACSGATTANVLTDDQAGQPPQIDAVGSGTRLVTVTIGGNDIDYLGSLDSYSCQDENGTNCGTVDTGAIATTLTVLTQRLNNVVRAVRARAPRARVLLVNYFTILPRQGSCDGVPLTTDQLGYERYLAAKLLSDTSAAARATGATVVNLAGASADHSACSARPWVNTFDVAAGLVPYHPNVTGMTNAARLVERALTCTVS
jgi:lysophospholipase L1-like esterase